MDYFYYCPSALQLLSINFLFFLLGRKTLLAVHPIHSFQSKSISKRDINRKRQRHRRL